ncbi:hypothetical protein B0H13DRAFT_2661357 [Mycena leptocephala]|nr:hypothetical protein B0H13DRAFT_2661357 [Mycena leptocephala]
MARDYHNSIQDKDLPDDYGRIMATEITLEKCNNHRPHLVGIATLLLAIASFDAKVFHLIRLDFNITSSPSVDFAVLSFCLNVQDGKGIFCSKPKVGYDLEDAEILLDDRFLNGTVSTADINELAQFLGDLDDELLNGKLGLDSLFATIFSYVFLGFGIVAALLSSVFDIVLFVIAKQKIQQLIPPIPDFPVLQVHFGKVVFLEMISFVLLLVTPINSHLIALNAQEVAKSSDSIGLVICYAYGTSISRKCLISMKKSFRDPEQHDARIKYSGNSEAATELRYCHRPRNFPASLALDLHHPIAISPFSLFLLLSLATTETASAADSEIPTSFVAPHLDWHCSSPLLAVVRPPKNPLRLRLLPDANIIETLAKEGLRCRSGLATRRTSALDSITVVQQRLVAGPLAQLVHQSSPYNRRRSSLAVLSLCRWHWQLSLDRRWLLISQSVSLGRCPTHLRSALVKGSKELPGRLNLPRPYTQFASARMHRHP